MSMGDMAFVFGTYDWRRSGIVEQTEDRKQEPPANKEEQR